MKFHHPVNTFKVLLKDQNQSYGGIILFNKNNTLSYQLVPAEPGQPYDHTGAAYYVVAVVLVYGLSIILLIASHIKRRHDKFVEDRQINRYLRDAPSLKEKSAKARWKELKMSFIPITLATVAIGNSMSVSEKPHLTTVSEETDDEVQELEAITIDNTYRNNANIHVNDTDGGEDESIFLLNDICETTDEEQSGELTECLSDGYTDSGIGNICGDKNGDNSGAEMSQGHKGQNNMSPVPIPRHNNTNGNYQKNSNNSNDYDSDSESTNNDKSLGSSPVRNSKKYQRAVGATGKNNVKNNISLEPEINPDTNSNDSPAAECKISSPLKHSPAAEQCLTSYNQCENSDSSLEETWVLQSPPVKTKPSNTPQLDMSRETQL